MKLQDVIFLIAVTLLVLLKKSNNFVYAGLTCLTLAIPLFAFWVFFTAERLMWYAAGFFILFIIFSLKSQHKVQ